MTRHASSRNVLKWRREMAAQEKTLWVQVMEAGFGATLETHGFRKISPRLYRLEGDGVTWEQFTYRGLPDIAGSFREGYGGTVAGADEIHRAAFGRPMSMYHGGRRYLYGFIGSLRYATDFIEYFETDRSRLRQIYKSIKQSLWRDERHFLEKKTPYFGILFKKGYWHTNGDSLEDVATDLSKLWLEYVWTDHLERQQSLREIVRLKHGEGRLGKRFFDDWATILNYLAGNRDLARRFLLHAIHCANLSEPEMTQIVVEDDEYLLHEDESSDPDIFPTIESAVRKSLKLAAREGDRARKLASVLDISL